VPIRVALKLLFLFALTLVLVVAAEPTVEFVYRAF
jgi:hypothetical protein